MSLNAAERTRTAEELSENLRLSTLTHAQVAARLGFTERKLEDTLGVGPRCHPADVWLLRDYLDQVIRARGEAAPAWTVLTDSARLAASRWFSLRPVPDPVPQEHDS